MSDGTSPAPKWAVRVKMWFVECCDLFARFAPGISSDKLSKTAISLSFAHQWLTSTNFVSEQKRLTCSSCTAWKKSWNWDAMKCFRKSRWTLPHPSPFFFFFLNSIPLFFLALCGVCLIFLLFFFILLAGGISLSYCCLFCALLLSFFLFFFLCLLSSISCFMETILDYCWTRTPWNLWATSISKYRK